MFKHQGAIMLTLTQKGKHIVMLNMIRMEKNTYNQHPPVAVTLGHSCTLWVGKLIV